MTIKLNDKEYNELMDCMSYIQELMKRENIEKEDIEFIDETMSMLRSNFK